MYYAETCYISTIQLKGAFALSFVYHVREGLDYYAWLADWKAGIPGTPEKYPGDYLGYVPKSSTVGSL